jgi:hypothetical protein
MKVAFCMAAAVTGIITISLVIYVVRTCREREPTLFVGNADAYFTPAEENHEMVGSETADPPPLYPSLSHEMDARTAPLEISSPTVLNEEKRHEMIAEPCDRNRSGITAAARTRVPARPPPTVPRAVTI